MGLTLMATRTKEQVEQYVEWQCRCKVIHSKPEQTFSDLGFEVTVWNVKTDTEGAWWVVEGERLPMNLYAIDQAYYFSADEAYSFHIGLMTRLLNDEAKKPENIIQNIAKGTEIHPEVKRKLEHAAQLLVEAVEVEEIQTVGMVCREALLSLINFVFSSDFLKDGEEEPKKADFKNRSRISIDSLLAGSENADLRDHMRKIAYAAWDFANQVTHSTSKTVYEASICLTLCTAVVSAFEDLLSKAHDPLSSLKCDFCGSRSLSLSLKEEIPESNKATLVCEKCGSESSVQLEIVREEE